MAKNLDNKKRKNVAVPTDEEAGFIDAMRASLDRKAGKNVEGDKGDAVDQAQDMEAATKYDASSSGASSVRQTLDATVESNMVKTVAAYQGMDFVDIPSLGLNHDKVRDLIRELGGDVVKQYKVMPLRVMDDGTLEVAISDPLDVTISDNLRMLTDRPIRTVVANENDIVDFVEIIWGVGDQGMEDVINDSPDDESSTLEQVGGADGAVDLESDPMKLAALPPIIRLVNGYLMHAIQDQASDLHFEPFRGMVRVRYRVDGVLRELPDPPKELQVGMVSRLKVMSNMNIAETRVPQDGRVRLNVEGREVDLRVSSLPTVHGESIVMRVLDKSMMMLNIDQLGFSSKYLKAFNEVIHYPNGIVLCCGPTGCGKTTTLYAALREVNDPGLKIITTEDPVEYQLPGLVQVNINTSVGLTFAACLRSILRQDPDDILVGEIRDVETAEIAIQAALTGHLVFSTIHANSASACATRLIDMGIEPFLITSTMQAIISQRLIRTICRQCGRAHMPTPEELAEFGMTPDDLADLAPNFLEGQGCDDCGHTGYKGRLGIYEFLSFDDELNDLILNRATSDEIQVMAVRNGMETMRVDGWSKAIRGVTSLSEVASHTPRESESSIKIEMDKTLNQGLSVDEEAFVSLPQMQALPTMGSDAGGIAAPWEHEAAARAGGGRN